MTRTDLPAVFRHLRLHRQASSPASVTEISEAHANDPFRVLVSCIISLRTKDEVTSVASERLFALADTPKRLACLPEDSIANAIYPAGFYRTKAATLRRISQDLLDRFEGKVPERLEDLLSLKGVGRKTANLVVTLGHRKPGICVDTHVHRISNRWGLVETKTPEETEFALREVLPRRYWIPINDLLVVYGQQICRPVSPHCSTCAIAAICRKVGVLKSR
jgi:endonuclease-3